MAIWLEIRCEKRGEIPDCWSDRNDGPSALSSEDRVSVLASLSGMEKQGRASGWKRTRLGWICPNCAADQKGAGR